MRYAPSLPPPVTTVEDWREVRALSAVRRARPVQTPVQTVVTHPQHRAVEPPPAIDRRVPEHESRRKVCRRVLHQPMLEELRSGMERRKSRQRDGDDIDHIDEEA